MVNVPVIAKRELNTYFLSLMGYLVLTLFALGNALVFALLLGGPQIDPNMVAGTMFGWSVTLMIFTAPMITMRLLSEETSSGTIESLMTTPVSEAEVVLGKYVGALLFAIVMLAPIALARCSNSQPMPPASTVFSLDRYQAMVPIMAWVMTPPKQP